MRLMASSDSQVRHLMFTWTLTNCIIDSVDQLEKALAAAVCAAQPTFLQVGQLLSLEVSTSWTPLLFACSHAAYNIHLSRYLQHLLNVPAVKMFSCPKLPVKCCLFCLCSNLLQQYTTALQRVSVCAW
jgi:hypothetical protein